MNKSALQSGAESLSNPNSKGYTYSCQERDLIRSKLRKKLGPEFISQRQGPGGRKLAYIAGDKCINVANYVFGFDGWSSVIRNIQTDFVDESSGKVSIGLSVIVRIVLKDGTFHEDIGYGEVENVRGKGPAFARAKKAGQTDALKRCLRNFGEVFNCLNDESYVKKALRLRTKDQPLDESNILRNFDQENETTASLQRIPVQPFADFIKQEVTADVTTEAEDEYGGDEFDDLEFFVEDQDLEGFLEDDSFQAINPLSNDDSTGQLKPKIEEDKPSAVTKNAAMNGQATEKPTTAPESRANESNVSDITGSNIRQQRPLPPVNRPQAGQDGAEIAPPAAKSNQGANQPSRPSQIQRAWDRDSITRKEPINAQPQQGQQRPVPGPPNNPSNPMNPPATFYSAKSELSDATRLEKPVFNPHLQSPSIPRSAGVDHSKSTPIPRGKYSAQAETSPFNPGVVSRPNFNGPGNTTLRPVGIPSQMSPGNRGYKPPTMLATAQQGGTSYVPQKRAFEGANAGGTVQRNALSEATKAQVNVREGHMNQQQPFGNEAKDHNQFNKKMRT